MKAGSEESGAPPNTGVAVTSKLLIDLSSRAQDSSRAILWIRSDIEISQGHEAICTVRPWEPFRPERLAIHVSCAESFDLIDFRVALCSVLESEDAVPAIRYAAKYKFPASPRGRGWRPGPHRALLSDETRLGLPIVNRVCSVGDDVSITVRHRLGTPPAALEVVVLGAVERYSPREPA